ncbi:UDP-glucose 4-epimerase Uge1, partial [Gonapodya sp. JEL0774]
MPALTRKTVLVTGGCGYIGSHCVVELLERNFSVVIVDDLSNSSTESTRRAEKITGRKILAFHNVSVCDEDALRGVFAAQQIDAVIHFA